MKNLLCHRAIFSVLVVCCSLNSTSVLAEIKTLDEAISVAGKQRTLTQQILKNYSLIGINVRARKAKQELEQAMALFDKQLIDLKEFSKDAATQQQLKTISELWQGAKVTYYADTSSSQVLPLNSKTDSLFNATDQLVLALVKTSPDDKGKILNTASTEQMLPQRIVALYALKAWGFAELYQAEYKKAVTEFEQGLSFLESHSGDSTEITADLTQVKQHFKRFTSTITASTTGNYSLAIASAAAEKIFSEMEGITLKYQQVNLKDITTANP
jgi:hypothetical protein